MQILQRLYFVGLYAKLILGGGDVVQLVRTLPCRWLESYTVTAVPDSTKPLTLPIFWSLCL